MSAISDRERTGSLVIIGGHEDHDGECVILRRIVDMAGERDGPVTIITTATRSPARAGEEYRRIFMRLGSPEARVLHVGRRRHADAEENLEAVRRAGAIFFTGGDQLRITATLGGTRLDRGLHRAFRRGTAIAGTSAGASVMSDTMIVTGPDDDAPKKCTTKMAPGLGLITNVVIDQHFAERGRIGRLLSAVAQNPFVLGIGLDEDTAVVVHSEGIAQVIGSQTATVIDARGAALTNASEQAPDEPLALSGVLLHVLPSGYAFNLRQRLPLPPEDDPGDHSG